LTRDSHPPIEADPAEFAGKAAGKTEVVVMKPGDALTF
jgi:hypothetical protein